MKQNRGNNRYAEQWCNEASFEFWNENRAENPQPCRPLLKKCMNTEGVKTLVSASFTKDTYCAVEKTLLERRDEGNYFSLFHYESCGFIQRSLSLTAVCNVFPVKIFSHFPLMVSGAASVQLIM